MFIILIFLITTIQADSYLRRISHNHIQIPLQNQNDIKKLIRHSLQLNLQLEIKNQLLLAMIENSISDQDKELTLKNRYNAQYFGTIKIGSYQHTVSALFDTGSSYTWVASKDCKGCDQAGIHKSFDCAASNTCHKSKDKIILNYGTGHGEAILFNDQLEISGLTVQNQTMLLLEELDKIKHFLGDGLVGLGFASLSDGHATLIDQLFHQKKISKKEFSIYLNDDENITTKNSTIILGGIDNKFVKKDASFKYCDVISLNYWGVQCNSVSFVSRDGNLRKGISIKPISSDYQQLQSKYMVIDSGTSIIVLYQPDFKQLISYLEAFYLFCYLSPQIQGMYQCDQSDLQKYPILQIELCGELYTITPEQYTICEGNICVLLLDSIDEPIAIAGDLFIRSYYTHFIQSIPRKIGFVEASI